MWPSLRGRDPVRGTCVQRAKRWPRPALGTVTRAGRAYLRETTTVCSRDAALGTRTTDSSSCLSFICLWPHCTRVPSTTTLSGTFTERSSAIGRPLSRWYFRWPCS
uniref:(northern house mosquito) hypothetical protein n=1 Tax=Culex pipiens TaxID=7175 RepID=A0A8D8BY06_CULPI